MILFVLYLLFYAVAGIAIGRFLFLFGFDRLIMKDLSAVGLVGSGCSVNFHPDSVFTELNLVEECLGSESGGVSIIYRTGIKGALDILPLTIV